MMGLMLPVYDQLYRTLEGGTPEEEKAGVLHNKQFSAVHKTG